MKIVVFDFDETLGYFVELSVFFDCINRYLKTELKMPELNQDQFNDLLDLYPEFLRPNILNILTYLKNKKKTNCCNKIMIYTNNTGPEEWSKNIISYFEKKLNYKLVDQIIAAFKINGKCVEICRTTHNKTHKDLIKCTKIPIDTEICFIDDYLYPDMAHDNIYYINIKPYIQDINFDEMLLRFKNSEIGKEIINDDNYFENLMMEHINVFA